MGKWARGKELTKAFDGLNRILEKVRETSHDFVVTTEIFPNLDVDRVARDMKLAEEGQARGAADQPSKSSKSLDDVELAIVSKVQDTRNTAYNNLEDQLHSFASRLGGLDFEGQFSDIHKANAEGVSNFKAEVVRGRNELHGLRRALNAAEEDYADFRRRHGITRAPRLSEGHVWFFKVSFLFFLFLVEAIMNGVFLAKGSDMGIVGGVTEAMSFSFLNIGIALVFALFCVSLTVHRSLFLKFLGYLSIGGYAALAVTLNLGLAHYREVAGSILEDAGPIVMDRIRHDPLGLVDIKSWLLFGIGLMFSIFAFIDGWYLKDPYLGYAAVYKRLLSARTTYATRQEDLIEELLGVRDDHNEKVDEIIRDLSGRRRDHNAIIAHRAKLLSLFVQYQEQLERTANVLLKRYREANAKARTEAAPKYFDGAYKLERIPPTKAGESELTDKDVAESIRKAQADLSDQIRKIAAVCDDGIDQYRELDKLHPETAPNG
ncbi:hypothetical protein EN804_03575 [Mesorhizobium sp. M8A.F.Ca.ET.161.01.1.1]|nr:hypothetical protein EN848_06540 [bacterium M00.F.Ca.ET.205.01.1.1]TGT92142.1 hypothetical protein EN804_03575 [Mesorhizobium sp. M8A.F.Ca.ET.161.01.1.1]TGU53731.1 hypothetical protein EN795_10960 [bacterium M00.F.Ca.ET.152.01.1.1]TGV37231.1 hypothetical protein EN829_010985 [Mesorhizobium sp. M00.F.Ca.ET.186.01.1.1]TGV45168.1 hypothetical protein EN785_03570 [Mesorhizobium sp. M8A.F.Ca.ET.142.01.1.1]TGZ39401.1 hypothetical protein EN805_29030 [bacterium M00.F.Ca.ET.162.01.1.1]